MERKVIVIAGPTCSGKTRLALDLAVRLDTEVISADSRQIFRYLDIGTAKPSPQELSLVRHHFIDELNPDEEFNVSIFENEAIRIIERLFAEGRVPVVAGGSGLYIRALMDGITGTARCDPDVRERLQKKLHESGKEALYEELKMTDPEAAAGMLPQNYKRVIRALEVYYTTGISILDHHKDYERPDQFAFDVYGLEWPREILYSNIEKRVDEMMENGLAGEVEKVLAMGYRENINSLNTVGYKEIISFLQGVTDLERAVELIKRNTRRYAKRQMTWFRADKRIQWQEILSLADISELADKIVLKYTASGIQPDAELD